MPCSAAGELLSLQQHHIAGTTFCQVIGDGTTDDAATDNDDPRPGWKFTFICHSGIPVKILFPLTVRVLIGSNII
jgi:hypothetical protein